MELKISVMTHKKASRSAALTSCAGKALVRFAEPIDYLIRCVVPKKRTFRFGCGVKETIMVPKGNSASDTGQQQRKREH